MQTIVDQMYAADASCDVQLSARLCAVDVSTTSHQRAAITAVLTTPDRGTAACCDGHVSTY